MSECGRVRSKEGKQTHSVRHGIRTWKQRVLRQKVTKDNTCRVCLYKDKEAKTWLVHRLVAKAFIPKEEGRELINHKDGSRLNNHVNNLEWCTYKENSVHAFETGLMRASRTHLTCKSTGDKKVFVSMAKAGEYLDVGTKYISAGVIRGNLDLPGYWIKVEEPGIGRGGPYGIRYETKSDE